MARPSVYLVTGPVELLVRRAAERLVEELSAEGEIELMDLAAGELEDGRLPDLRTGSLFGSRRVVVIRDAGQLPAQASAALLAELDGGPLDATIILLATTTGRIQKVARAVKELGGRIDVAPPPDYSERGWKDLVAEEFARHGRAASRSAVDAILAHSGTDAAVVAEKVAQVCASAPAGTITDEQVDHVVVGHGSRGSFAIADAMCRREPAEALTLLRGALESGDDPVMILGALVYRIRALVAVAGGMDPHRAGLSISPGQSRHLDRDRRRFGTGELTVAYRVLADADAALKGGEVPPDLVIERAVVEIATAR
jgi:DNA polymerase III subunit delta